MTRFFFDKIKRGDLARQEGGLVFEINNRFFCFLEKTKPDYPTPKITPKN